jgi:chromate transporter
MNLVILYLLLLKATATSFSGLTSLPVVRNDFVAHRQVLTDRQLNAAVVAGRSVPGPNGLYIVSVGYFIAGIPGACAGWLALVSPAFVMIPLLRYVGARAERPAIRSAIQALTLAAAGLIASATIPLARDALHGPVSIGIAAGSFLIMAFTERDTLWVIGGSALVGLLAGVLGYL